MKIIYIFILIFLLKLGFYAFSQTDKKSQNEFLILGTLQDYMGRKLDPRFENLLDRYDPSEDTMKSIIDSLVKITYPKEVYQDMEMGVNTILSTFLANRFNAFYHFNKGHSYTPNGGNILIGKLKDDIMRNEKEKLAFLTGAFLRFGSIRDSAYCISIANSISKAKVCYTLLKELGCKPYYNIRRNYIPVGHDVFFIQLQKFYLI
ncbi:hypothetical protein [Pedobacter glucosidilyticus]|uniref:hypothetical protein n=1 Tax=Pedobacter glucosidilyticus TaxID=1122941 RepID=UPI0026ED3AF3|nr:hypothetical protein [Pedobacter glucosidilyticus]